MKTLTLNLSPPYSIYLGNDFLLGSFFSDYCKKMSKRLVIITDDHLVDTLGNALLTHLEAKGCNVMLLSFAAGEANKTRETKHALEDTLLAKKYGRDTCLIALGGGVVSDLVGFLAATYCRGIPVIYVPTTLLAMVDASIGGKTGVNTPYGKNLLGTFTQPQAVFMDIAMLNTLPQQEWNNGFVEMIKHSVIADRVLFHLIQQNVSKLQNRDADFLLEMIYASCVIKKNIVEQDEREANIRQLLNFGHTIGHAIEACENFQVSHGEAVAIGMLVETFLSTQAGFLAEEEGRVLSQLLQELGLPLTTAAFLDHARFTEKLVMDKKSIENVAQFVLLDQLGKPHREKDFYTMPVDPILLKDALVWAAQQFSPRGLS